MAHIYDHSKLVHALTTPACQNRGPLCGMFGLVVSSAALVAQEGAMLCVKLNIVRHVLASIY
jgi:hypothetical protein